VGVVWFVVLSFLFVGWGGFFFFVGVNARFASLLFFLHALLFQPPHQTLPFPLPPVSFRSCMRGIVSILE